MNKPISKEIFEEILLDPTKIYDVPESVLADDKLTRAQKIIVLQQWAYDAKELQVAEEENMAGDSSPTMLSRVLLALHRLEEDGS